MRRVVPAAHYFAGILMLVGAMWGSAAEAGCGVGRIADLPMTIAHDGLFVPLTINDVTGHFLVDTGAFHSILDSSFASAAGVRWDFFQPQYTISGIGGETLPVRAGRLRMLVLGGMRVPDREMPIHDFGHDTREPQRLDGLLGADLLSVLDVELDFSAGKLTLWRLFNCRDIEPLHWSGDYAAIPMKRMGDGHLQIPIWIDNADLDAILDTGASSGLILTRQAARQAGALDADLANDPEEHLTGVSGGQYFKVHRSQTLLIGKEVYHNVKAFVGDGSPGDKDRGSLVGISYLLNHKVWLSYGTQTLFLQPTAK